MHQIITNDHKKIGNNKQTYLVVFNLKFQIIRILANNYQIITPRFADATDSEPAVRRVRVSPGSQSEAEFFESAPIALRIVTGLAGAAQGPALHPPAGRFESESACQWAQPAAAPRPGLRLAAKWPQTVTDSKTEPGLSPSSPATRSPSPSGPAI